MKYFTADLHLAHHSVAARRGYEEDSHDRMIINKINARVGKDDELYVLGDISSGTTESIRAALSKLRDLYVPAKRRHLILGNHENFKVRDSNLNFFQEQFGYIEVMSIVKIHETDFIISHLPCERLLDDRKIEGFPENAFDPSMKTYAPFSGYQFYLHGHTHMTNNTITMRKDYCEYEDYREQLLYWYSLDVGVDGHNFFPWSEEEILNHFDIL